MSREPQQKCGKRPKIFSSLGIRDMGIINIQTFSILSPFFQCMEWLEKSLQIAQINQNMKKFSHFFFNLQLILYQCVRIYASKTRIDVGSEKIIVAMQISYIFFHFIVYHKIIYIEQCFCLYKSKNRLKCHHVELGV